MEKSSIFGAAKHGPSVQEKRPNSLIIIGASTRAACQSARRSGFAADCIDQFGDADLIEIARRVWVSENWPDDIVQLAAEALKKSPDSAIMLAGGLENYPEIVAELSQMGTLAGCSAKQISRLRDPVFLQRTLANAGLKSLEVQLFGARLPAGKWIQKRLNSAGGLQVAVLENSESSNQTGNQIGPDEFAQEFVDASISSQPVEYSGLYLATGAGVQMLGLCEQWIGERAAGAKDFQYSGSLLANCRVRDESTRNIGSEDSLFFQATSIGAVLLNGEARGIIGIDFIWNAMTNDLNCLEVNPRYPASTELYERLFQWPIIQWHIDACLTGADFDLERIKSDLRTSAHCDRCAGKLVVYASSDSLGPIWPEVQTSRSWPSGVEIADRPTDRVELVAGHPVCTLLTESKTVQDCRDKLLLACQLLDV